jgi:hypothetical protein
MVPYVTTQFGDKKVSIWITEEQLKELKKAFGKDSAYGAAKAAIMAGYEHVKNCSAAVESYDKLVKEIKEMPLSQLEKKSKKLRLYGRHDVQSLNEELVHYACSGSAYTLVELVHDIFNWAGRIAKAANISFEEAMRMRFFGDLKDVERAVGYYSESLARDIAAFRHYANRYEEMDGVVNDKPKADLNDIIRRKLQEKKERKRKEGNNGRNG